MSIPELQPRNRARVTPRIAEAAVERARLTVVPRGRTSAPRVPFVALISAIMLVGVVSLLLFNTSMQQASFAATSLESRADSLAAREQSLQMQLASMRDPQHLAEKARRLGMVKSGTPAFLSLDGKVTGQPHVAQRGDSMRIEPKAPVKPKKLTPAPVVEGPSGLAVEERGGGSAGRGTETGRHGAGSGE